MKSLKHRFLLCLRDLSPREYAYAGQWFDAVVRLGVPAGTTVEAFAAQCRAEARYRKEHVSQLYRHEQDIRRWTSQMKRAMEP